MSALSGGGSENFPFHFVLFPTPSLLSLEGFTVVAQVTKITAIERRVVNLLAHPFLPCRDHCEVGPICYRTVFADRKVLICPQRKTAYGPA
jgi:hypothetical protein